MIPLLTPPEASKVLLLQNHGGSGSVMGQDGNLSVALRMAGNTSLTLKIGHV